MGEKSGRRSWGSGVEVKGDRLGGEKRKDEEEPVSERGRVGGRGGR